LNMLQMINQVLPAIAREVKIRVMKKLTLAVQIVRKLSVINILSIDTMIQFMLLTLNKGYSAKYAMKYSRVKIVLFDI